VALIAVLTRVFHSRRPQRFQIHWKLQDSFFDDVVPNPGKNGRPHLGWAQDDQPGGRAGSH
jgi:hypothetical protein